MSILERIVADTRTLIASRQRSRSTSDLRSLPGYDRVRRGFAESLRTRDVSIIAEIKRQSPSKGIIRMDFDVASLARSYSEAGAAAISVLTEPTHFGGDLDYLGQALAASSVPILRKDFVVDPYQVIEARAYGADAVLLIATVLSTQQLSELQSACTEEGLEALVEVYSAEELDKIDVDNTPVIGANNRDLKTFEVDINRSHGILSTLPSQTVKVAESGLAQVDDLRFLLSAGINAFLIGERFMIEPDPGVVLGNWIGELAT